jgi:hypothetical protein
MDGRTVGHKFERDPHKDHACQIWFNGFREDLNVKFFNCIELKTNTTMRWDGKKNH